GLHDTLLPRGAPAAGTGVGRRQMTNKTLIVAASEFNTQTRSKAFMIGLLMMPVFMIVAMGVQKFTRDATDVKDRTFAVVDRTGALFAPLKAAADEWNAGVKAGGTQTAPLFLTRQEAFGQGAHQAARAR